MSTKRTPCKDCEGDLFSADHEGDTPVWRCLNCDALTHRRVRSTQQKQARRAFAERFLRFAETLTA